MRTDGAQRRKEARIRRRKRLVRSIAVFVILAALGYLLFWTELFHVESIEFLDYEYVDESLLLERSGLEVDRHIFFLDTGKAVENLNQLGYVKSASIVRVFPDQIKVYITPRHPALVLKWNGGYAYVDQDGIIAEVTQSSSRWDLPLVSGLEEEVNQAVEGESCKSDPSWMVKEAMDIVNILLDEDLMDNVTEIHVTQEMQFHLYTEGGSVIKITDSENMKSKIDFLFTYLREKDDRMVIDLTHGGNPTYTPR